MAFAGCLAVLGVAVAASSEQRTSRTPPVTVGQVPLFTASGVAPAVTDRFTVTGRWSVRWTWTGERVAGVDTGMLMVGLRGPGGLSEGLIVGATMSGAGVWYGDAGAGRIYSLEVKSSDGRWRVEVVDPPG